MQYMGIFEVVHRLKVELVHKICRFPGYDFLRQPDQQLSHGGRNWCDSGVHP